MVARHRKVDQSVEALPVDQRLQPVTDQDVRRGFSGFGVHLYPDRVVRPGIGMIPDIGFEPQDLRLARALDVEIHRDKGRVLDRDPPSFNRRDKDIPVVIAPQDRREEPHQRRPVDRRSEVIPRPVPRDPHVQIAAVIRVPLMNRRQPAPL